MHRNIFYTNRFKDWFFPGSFSIFLFNSINIIRKFLISTQCPVDSLIFDQCHIQYTTLITSRSIPNNSSESTNSTIFDGMDRGWIATATLGRQLKAPFAAGEDDVCALLASKPREGSSCAAKGKGWGNGESLAATTTGVGGTMGGAIRWPILIARSALSYKIFHPRVSPRSLFPTFTYQDVAV